MPSPPAEASPEMPPGAGRGASGWIAAWILAIAWSVLPALPALLQGGLLGSPWTDLYPSVWGLGWFAAAQPGLPSFAAELAAPAGMGFYYSSPLHGWVATPLLPLIGVVGAYNLTILLARAGTVLAAFGAGRAFGLGPAGALVAAAVYGTAPFFHGYAVEGIVEGTDGWALALVAWAIGRGRPGGTAIALALCIYSSWYLGIVGCVLVLFAVLRDRRMGLALLGGIALAAPGIVAFGRAFPGVAPLDPSVRALMGARLGVPRPGILPGDNPFAMNTYLGWIAGGLAVAGARRRPALAWIALIFAVLSLGVGPWYQLPVLRSLRFVYRWHAGTLGAVALLAGGAVESWRPRSGGRRWIAPMIAPMIAVMIAIEGLVLSPVEPLIPSAPAEVPAIYADVRGPILLEIPGPVAMAPGQVNHSRPRSRYLLYYQLFHHAASPWAPDFNGVGAGRQAAWLDSFASWDPLEKRNPEAPDLAGARAAGVTQILVHRDELRHAAAGLEAALQEGGASLEREEGVLALYGI